MQERCHDDNSKGTGSLAGKPIWAVVYCETVLCFSALNNSQKVTLPETETKSHDLLYMHMVV